MSTRSVQEIVVARLTAILGPDAARVALRTFAERSGRSPDTLTRADVPALLAAMLPMLRTLIGRERAEYFTRQISRELE